MKLAWVVATARELPSRRQDWVRIGRVTAPTAVLHVYIDATVVAVLSSADDHHLHENPRHAACASRQHSKQYGAARPDSIDEVFETVNLLDDK